MSPQCNEPVTQHKSAGCLQAHKMLRARQAQGIKSEQGAAHTVQATETLTCCHTCTPTDPAPPGHPPHACTTLSHSQGATASRNAHTQLPSYGAHLTRKCEKTQMRQGPAHPGETHLLSVPEAEKKPTGTQQHQCNYSATRPNALEATEISSRT